MPSAIKAQFNIGSTPYRIAYYNKTGTYQVQRGHRRYSGGFSWNPVKTTTKVGTYKLWLEWLNSNDYKQYSRLLT